jgi:hypothetical protein
MKIQTLIIATAAAVILAACVKPEPPEATPGPPEQQPKQDQENVAGPTEDSTKAAYWMNVKYTIDYVPSEHKGIPHVALGGTIEIVERNGEYRVTTVDGDTKWPDGYHDVVLIFNEQGTHFCSWTGNFKALTQDKQNEVVAFVKGPAAYRFLSKDPVKLHERDEQTKEPPPHDKHVINICPVDPDPASGKKEILIMTYTDGAGHDGISHGST